MSTAHPKQPTQLAHLAQLAQLAQPTRFLSALLLCLLVCGCAPVDTSVPPPTPTVITEPATVTIGAHGAARPIPSYFAGFSIEPKSLCQFLQIEQHNPTLDRLYQNLGPTTIRFGGTSMDASTWDPSSPCSGLTFGRSTIAEVFAFAQRVHANVIWGLNLKSGAADTAADEAQAVSAAANGRLLGFEMGNEPNGWASEPVYEQAWRSYASAITKAGIHPNFVGPSTYNDGTQSWLAQFVQNRRSQLAIVTYHYYPLQQGAAAGDPLAPTIANLLSPALMARTASNLDQVVQIAHSNGLPLEIDETNSVNGGGVLGVSDTFASALWATDYLFTAAEHGVLAVNLHGDGGTNGGPAYSPIFTDPHTHDLVARPLYYGMLFFHLATGDGQSRALPASVTANSASANLATHAVKDANGALRVALINKDTRVAVRVRVALGVDGAAYRSGQVVRLLAPSVTATGGVTLGGASVGADGAWAISEQDSVSVTNASFTITVPPASAALVILAPQTPQTPQS